jgi:hypothetical protein
LPANVGTDARLRIHWACVALVAGALIAALAACRQLVGIGDSPPSGVADASAEGGAGPGIDAGGSCGPAFASGDCQSCISSYCCLQAAACGTTPTCSALESCLGACSADAGCRAQCGVDHGLGNDPATPAFEACLAGQCATECGLSCGGLAAVFPPARAADCEACIVKGPCADVTACATDLACQARIRCWFSSETLDVQQACAAGLDGGMSLANAGADPLAGSCSADCSWGSDWSCVGNVHWPPANLGPVTVTVNVLAAGSSDPIAGAAVEVCTSGDPTCSPPRASGPTDQDGSATLVRQSIPSAETEYVDITSPQIAPTDVFFFFPVSEAQGTVQVSVFTPAQVAGGGAIVGIPIDPDAGGIVVTQHDCRGGLAPGVSFSLAPKGSSQVVYFAGGQLDVGATATDTTGTAIVFNAPALPNALVLTATLPDAGQPMSRMHIFARRAGIAIVYGLPTP